MSEKKTILERPKMRFECNLFALGHTKKEILKNVEFLLERAEIDGAWDSCGSGGWIKLTENTDGLPEEEYNIAAIAYHRQKRNERRKRHSP